MSQSMLLPLFSVVLLPRVTCLFLERQVNVTYDTCEDAWDTFWVSNKHSVEETESVDFIKTSCSKETACNYHTPAPTPCEGNTCDLWADPHVSGFDNTELQGPEYLFLASHIGKSNSSGVEEFHHQDKLNVSHRLTHKTTFTNKLRTFDQRPVDVNALDAGDFWLVKNRDVFIQGRFRLAQEFLPDNAAVGAIAVGGPFLDGDRIIIEPLDGQLLLNTFAMPSGNISMQTTSGNISILHYKERTHHKKHRKHTDSQDQEEEEHADVNLELPKGVNMVIRRWKRHLDVKIRMPKLEGGVDGECGNMNGIPDDDTENLIAKRMGSLRIEEQHKLFQKSFTVNVRLDADGLIAVQNSNHPRAVRDFIHAVLADSGAQVLSESELSGLVPYYDGQIDRKGYQDLVSELQTAPWVQGFETPTGKTIFQIAMDELSDLFR